MSVQSDLLNEVASIVSGERNKNYGPPYVNLDQRTARLWTEYLRTDEDIWYSRGFDGIDVCNMMILLKMARIMETRNVKDNYADIAGYAAAAWEIANVRAVR
jgi:hypothetical protein